MSSQTETRPATGGSPVADLDVEREIDLRQVWNGIRAQWWIVVAGVVAGVIVGALFSLSGGSVYEATAHIAPGQAFSPGGTSQVLTYLTNPTAINRIATSEATIEEAAAKAGVSARELRGNVSTAAVSSEGTPTQRSAVLVEITARLNKKKKAEDAANAVARIVQRQTTSRYVRQSIAIYRTRIDNFNERLTTLQKRIDLLDKAFRQPGLSLNDSLLLAIQLDQAQATQGQTIDSLTTAQQQQTLAEDVSQTQIVQDARGSKISARSRRNSMLVGGLIGLIAGLCAAIIIDRRANRARPA
jgi:capsular polysaccharide biosynthesis protein